MTDFYILLTIVLFNAKSFDVLDDFLRFEKKHSKDFILK